MRTLDQIRAARAYEVMAAADSDLLDLARKLPVMLRTNGLLATWTFCLAKSDRRRCLERALLPHLRDEVLGLGVAAGPADEVFRGWVGPARPLDGVELRRLTEEAVAFAGWLKRAAEAHT